MTSDPIEPVAKQWRCVEDGQERTDWQNVNVGDHYGWVSYSENYPGKVVIEYRDIYGPEVLARADRAEALLAEAEKALEPIAAEARHWDDYVDENEIVEPFGEYAGELTVGDLRRARATLTKIKEAQHADNR